MSEPTAAPQPITVIHAATDSIVASPYNKRIFHKKDPSLAELASSIRTDGVQQPVLVRPLEDGTYQLVFGERRWRASILAHKPTLPCIVREMDDREARRLVVVENFQRVNLHPLEEAESFCELLDNGYTLDEVSAELGKSVTFIARRARLSKLTKEWRKAIGDDAHPASKWTAPMLEMIARFPDAAQDDLFGSISHSIDSQYSIDDLRRISANKLHILSSAPWKESDETLDVKAGPCTTCMKRSDTQPELFDDAELELKPGKGACAACLDVACFNRKMMEFLKRKDAALKSEHSTVLHIKHNYHGAENTPWKDTAVQEYELDKCKKSDPSAVPALVVSGPRAGQTQWVKPRKSSQTSKPNRTGATEKSLAERRADLAAARSKIVTRLVIDRLEAFISSPDLAEWDSETEPLAFVLAFGTDTRCELHTEYSGATNPWDTYDTARGETVAELVSRIVKSAAGVVVRRFRTALNWNKPVEGEIRRVCEQFGWDLAELQAEAERQKPEPKSWAKLGSEPAQKPKRGKTAA